MEIATGYHSLTPTTHPLNVNLPSSGQQGTARLSACKVSDAGGIGAEDPLVRDATVEPNVIWAGWAPGSVWTRTGNLETTRILLPDRPTRIESLYQLSYPGPFY
jgi:hypothetical protein